MKFRLAVPIRASEGEVMEKLQLDITEMKTQGTLVAASIKSMTDTIAAMGIWMLQVDGSIEALKTTLDGVDARVAVLESEHQPPEATITPRPDGHDIDKTHQGAAAGLASAPAHALVRGKRDVHNTPVHFELDEQSHTTDHTPSSGYRDKHSTGCMPKAEFPKFDGENPAWWKKVAEKYFVMYDVDTWEELVVSVKQKFGRDKSLRHLETLEHMVQVALVDEYHHKFEELMHRVLVYNKNYDEAFFVTKFVKGLKPEIQSAILLHKTRTVDSVLPLAQTQEDLLEEPKQTMVGRYKSEYKSVYKPAITSKGILGAAPEHRIVTEEKAKLEQKMDALKAIRKAKGLCFKCGEKYHRGHKCAPSPQLQLIEELLLLLDVKLEAGADPEEDDSDSDTEGLMHLSECATAGTTTRKTIRLHAMLNGHQAQFK